MAICYEEKAWPLKLSAMVTKNLGAAWKVTGALEIKGKCPVDVEKM